MRKSFTNYPANRQTRRRARRRGTLIVYVALGLSAFIGAAALSVDMGNLYARKARAQVAADSAALAGAYQLARGSVANANTAAKFLTKSNGYDDDDAAVEVTTTYPVNNDFNRYRVRVRRTEPTFFTGLMGFASRPVSASATAIFSVAANQNISNSGDYGVAGGPTTLTLYGPDGLYSFGDYASPRFLDNGEPNPNYHDPDATNIVERLKAGFNFTVNIPSTYDDGSKITKLEIFDPDTYNAGNFPYVTQGVRVDELRRPWNVPENGQGSNADATTTRYTLYWDRNGSGDQSTFEKIGEISYAGDPQTDMQWIEAFNIDHNLYPTGKFVLNVASTAGSSENGFQLRAGPVVPAGGSFDPQNGSSITANGRVPMNFAGNGNAPFVLGDVPKEMAGKTFSIRKYDTDIGSQYVNYSYKTADGTIVNWDTPGVLAGNGEFTTDTFTLPLDYSGGTWLADYQAGANDTSVWEMSFAAAIPGEPGPIRLVE